jgi:hypothetical protein
VRSFCVRNVLCVGRDRDLASCGSTALVDLTALSIS